MGRRETLSRGAAQEARGRDLRSSTEANVLLFFALSVLGWLWEVLLCWAETGSFCNRGVLYGPWLPIYGTGGLLILLGLRRVRGRPVLLFVLSILSSGLMEYAVSWFLEQRYGMRWWDYSGYALNLRGRVCAEGLLLFGFGSVAMVYGLAPLLERLCRRAPKRLLQCLELALIAAVVVDALISARRPNMACGPQEVTGTGLLRLLLRG